MTFEETFNSWSLDEKVKWVLGPNIFNLSSNVRSIIVALKEENQTQAERIHELEKALESRLKAIEDLRAHFHSHQPQPKRKTR